MNQKYIRAAWALVACIICTGIHAQSEDIISDQSLDEIEVIGTRAPLTAAQSVRMVQVINREQIKAASVQSVNDLLKLAASIDVRQRGAYGVQTDIGINGGTSDQLTVLLNGVNISNPHTGHLTVDLPVAVSDIERIEVLSGGASRVFGSSAFSGAINIITRTDKKTGAEVKAEGGSFGTFNGNARLGIANQLVQHQFSGGYTRSNGGTENSDFNKAQAFWQGNYENEHVEVKWQTGMSRMNYGANTFYSASFNNQYEENRRYLASITAETKGKFHFAPSIYWNRSFDHYLLKRDDPAFYENFHQANVYGLNLNAYFTWKGGKTAFGTEVRNEGILSNNLGRPLDDGREVKVPGHDALYTKSDNRTNISYYLEHDVLLERMTLSVGLLANMNTALDHRFRLYPGVDISYRPWDGWKMFASFNQALRLPTFTDLYYQSPTINGNVGLKPEKSTDFSLGIGYTSSLVSAQLKGFYRIGTDMIDWVKYHAEDTYHATNFDLNNRGIETQVVLDFTELWGKNSMLQRFSANYCYIYQTRKDNTEIYRSNFALDYLKNKLTFALNHRIWNRLNAQWDLRLQHRNGMFELYEAGKTTGTLTPYGTYALLDLKVQWTAPKYTLYLQGNNLTNHKYYDLANVQQPGFWFMGGISWKIF